MRVVPRLEPPVHRAGLRRLADVEQDFRIIAYGATAVERVSQLVYGVAAIHCGAAMEANWLERALVVGSNGFFLQEDLVKRCSVVLRFQRLDCGGARYRAAQVGHVPHGLHADAQVLVARHALRQAQTTFDIALFQNAPEVHADPFGRHGLHVLHDGVEGRFASFVDAPQIVDFALPVERCHDRPHMRGDKLVLHVLGCKRCIRDNRGHVFDSDLFGKRYEALRQGRDDIDLQERLAAVPNDFELLVRALLVLVAYKPHQRILHFG